MNNKFIVGKWYKLRNDYPVRPNECDVITFEGRETAWIPVKQPFLDKKPRRVIKVDKRIEWYWIVTFEGIKNGGWKYHPEDFDQMDSDKVLALEDEVTILKKQVTYLKQEVKVLEIGSKLLLETGTIPDLIITPKKGNHELKDYLTRLEIESLVEKKIDDAKRGY